VEQESLSGKSDRENMSFREDVRHMLHKVSQKPIDINSASNLKGLLNELVDAVQLALSKLSGDLNHNNIAEAKHILKSCLWRYDTPWPTGEKP
jgi:hypothetical protein